MVHDTVTNYLVTAGNRELYRPKITVFHCFNTMHNLPEFADSRARVSATKLPCSSMIREIFLLRAFEDGADAVVLLACPEGNCQYMEGNLRAAKRLARIKILLDEIGISGRRLNIYNVSSEDRPALEQIIDQTIRDLENLGRNPAARPN